MLAALFATLAYLTSTTNTLDNVMTAGSITAALDEQKTDTYGTATTPASRIPENPTPSSITTGNTYTVLPGHTYTKDPQMHIAKGSESCYAYIILDDQLLSTVSSVYGTNDSPAKQMTDSGWTEYSDAKLPEGKTGKVYYYNNIVSKDTTQDTTLTTFTKFILNTALTQDQITSLNEKHIIVNGAAIQSDGFSSATDAWKAVYGEKASWKPLTATVAGSTVNYYPVLGGTNPQPDAFAYSTDGGTTFTEIAKPEGGYTMTGDVATYAKAGQLYYNGGSVNTVRSVNDISWNNTWVDNSSGTYPYYASTLQTGTGTISEKIDSTNETVEKVTAQTSGAPTDTPVINGVKLLDIWTAYKDGTSTGFGGQYGVFWSCVADSSTSCYVWYGNVGGHWTYASRSNSNYFCVLVSRAFS